MTINIEGIDLTIVILALFENVYRKSEHSKERFKVLASWTSADAGVYKVPYQIEIERAISGKTELFTIGCVEFGLTIPSSPQACFFTLDTTHYDTIHQTGSDGILTAQEVIKQLKAGQIKTTAHHTLIIKQSEEVSVFQPGNPPSINIVPLDIDGGLLYGGFVDNLKVYQSRLKFITKIFGPKLEGLSIEFRRRAFFTIYALAVGNGTKALSIETALFSQPLGQSAGLISSHTLHAVQRALAARGELGWGKKTPMSLQGHIDPEKAATTFRNLYGRFFQATTEPTEDRPQGPSLKT